MSEDALRIDKWLWHARFVKSRTLGQKLAESGKVRLNKDPVVKAHTLVRAEDVLTFPLGPYIRVIKVLALGTRRGPAKEAQELYEDLAPPQPEARVPKTDLAARREKGAGRPTKRDRRALDKLKGDGG